jgi:alcohol dehydrogenase
MRNDQDIDIDCTVDGSGHVAALNLVRPRGKIMLKSLHAAIDPQSISGALDAIVRHEVEVIGSFVGSLPDALAALAANTIDVVSLISRRVPMRDGVAALKSAAQRDGLCTLLLADD